MKAKSNKNIRIIIIATYIHIVIGSIYTFNSGNIYFTVSDYSVSSRLSDFRVYFNFVFNITVYKSSVFPESSSYNNVPYRIVIEYRNIRGINLADFGNERRTYSFPGNIPFTISHISGNGSIYFFNSNSRNSPDGTYYFYLIFFNPKNHQLMSNIKEFLQNQH